MTDGCDATVLLRSNRILLQKRLQTLDLFDRFWKTKSIIFKPSMLEIYT